MTDPILFMALGAICVLALFWAKARFWSFTAQQPADYAQATPQFDRR